MSKCLLVGIEENNWTDKKSGEFVESSILHVVHDKPARADYAASFLVFVLVLYGLFSFIDDVVMYFAKRKK